MAENSLIILAGPTAIGKTALAIKIARHLQTEIVSADSRQFYREMAIGTAKPTPVEQQAVKHHLVDSHSIHSELSVGDYEAEALSILESIFERKDVAVLTGGSGLFIKAITDGLDDLPKAPSEVREELNRLHQEHGIVALQERLKAVDPAYYSEVDINNPQRLIRALEVCAISEIPFSALRQKTKKERNFLTIKIALEIPREQLYSRINLRVDKMVELGLFEEAKALYKFKSLNALNTVGYTEIFDYIDGRRSLNHAIESIKQNTRRYAKRQLTWFRKDSEYTWFHPDDYEQIINHIEHQLHLTR